jgi:hypothetical protein
MGFQVRVGSGFGGGGLKRPEYYPGLPLETFPGYGSSSNGDGEAGMCAKFVTFFMSLLLVASAIAMLGAGH